MPQQFGAETVHSEHNPADHKQSEKEVGALSLSKLSRSLTANWHLPDKTIEIGNTVLTANGAITHIVHLMSKQSMTGYAEELFGHSPDRTISASEIARRFDRVHRLEISKIFRSHFGLSDAFNVVFCDRISRSKRAVSAMKGSQHRVHSGESYLVELHSPTVPNHDKKSLFNTALDVLFSDDEEMSFGEKKEKILEFTNQWRTEKMDRERNQTVRSLSPMFNVVEEEEAGNVMLEMTKVRRDGDDTALDVDEEILNAITSNFGDAKKAQITTMERDEEGVEEWNE